MSSERTGDVTLHVPKGENLHYESDVVRHVEVNNKNAVNQQFIVSS